MAWTPFANTGTGTGLAEAPRAGACLRDAARPAYRAPYLGNPRPEFDGAASRLGVDHVMGVPCVIAADVEALAAHLVMGRVPPAGESRAWRAAGTGPDGAPRPAWSRDAGPVRLAIHFDM